MQAYVVGNEVCSVDIQKTLSNRSSVELSLMSLESEAGNLLSY